MFPYYFGSWFWNFHAAFAHFAQNVRLHLSKPNGKPWKGGIREKRVPGEQGGAGGRGGERI